MCIYEILSIKQQLKIRVMQKYAKKKKAHNMTFNKAEQKGKAQGILVTRSPHVLLLGSKVLLSECQAPLSDSSTTLTTHSASATLASLVCLENTVSNNFTCPNTFALVGPARYNSLPDLCMANSLTTFIILLYWYYYHPHYTNNLTKVN